MRITLLSNGYGEDTVGATLAAALLAHDPELTVQAFPTVGPGRAYERLKLPVLGPCHTLPSGGLMLHTVQGFWADLRAGFLPLTGAQLRELRRLETDALIVVGDVYALLLGSFVRTRRRFYVQTLVSVSGQHRGGRVNRYFMERFSAPERLLMRRVQHAYVRDAATAAYLAGFGLPVSALGNPMLDTLRPGPPLGLPLTTPVVALLPGTRSYREAALETMLRALACWPEATGLIAWTDASPPELPGRRWHALTEGVWQGAPNVYLVRDRFAEVLGTAHLVLGTAGTANEQAAASGRPVVAFAVPPLYTPAFLANQRRLLGDALTLCDADPASLSSTLRALWTDRARYEVASRAGRLRMGAGGGGSAIALDVLERMGAPRFH